MSAVIRSSFALVVAMAAVSDAARAPPAGAAAPVAMANGGCKVTLTIDNSVAKLDVNGELNGHGIELAKQEEARPVGNARTPHSPCLPPCMHPVTCIARANSCPA
jgi:hypothetical protein